MHSIKSQVALILAVGMVTTALAQVPAQNRGAAATEDAPDPQSLLTIKPAPPDAASPSPDPRNFEGLYAGAPMRFEAAAEAGGPFGPPEKYTSKGQVRVQRRMALAMKQLEEPLPAFFCRPYANLSNVAQPAFPSKVVQTNKRVVFLTEEGRGVWEIFLDREHPQGKALKPTYNGHSVGHWEGDTLVVDIVGFNGKGWLDLQAGPNSTRTHATAWIKKIENGRKLEVKYQLEDPDLYQVKPKIRSSVLEWHPELHLAEFGCEESVGIGTFPSQSGAGYADTDFSKYNEWLKSN